MRGSRNRGGGTGRTIALLAVFLLAALGQGSTTDRRAPNRAASCPQPAASAADDARIDRALRSGPDVWGAELLASREGPTYEGVRRYLKPLLLARAPMRAALTESGVHYLAFAVPNEARGAQTVALHVADGSQILSQRADGPRLTVAVGSAGRERYGSCLARLTGPGLLAGYLPVLQTRYVDSAGVRYRQESFVARLRQTHSLVSFVELSADARASTVGTVLRFTPSVSGLDLAGGRLVRGGRTYLVVSPGGAFDGSSLRYPVAPRTARTVRVAWLVSPAAVGPMSPDRSTYETARGSVTAYWRDRLAEGATIQVPDERVVAAQQNLLVQNLVLTWRYSIGNPYEEFSFPEGVDVAQVMAAYGFRRVSRAILETSLTRRPTPYPNWKIGQKLVGSAVHYRLFRDRSYVDDVTPVLRGYVAELARQIDGSERGILRRERYSSDIADSVYGLHSQAVVWQGLESMASVWRETGHTSLAETSSRLAARLATGLRRAIRLSQRRLADGSLFIPVRLLDDEVPYDKVTASRSGSYWNLVAPYALASGIFAPGSPEAEGALRYMLLHGSRLLGLVRAGAYALYGKRPAYPASGTDQVYGLNVARFLADNDEADQLVLSLYGHLAAGMTPGTFVSGEAASVAPLGRADHRAMYLPPNGASNAAFLETLRVMLVHEVRGGRGASRGLELAYATPRRWLAPGTRVVVRNAPTSFGPLSFTMQSRQSSVHIVIDVPGRATLRKLALRLRLPSGSRITGVVVNGRPFAGLDARHETIVLPTRAGRLDLVARVARPT